MSDYIIKRLREAIADHPLSPIHGYAADIAALLDRLDAAERERDSKAAELANLQVAFSDWKVFHSTARLEAENERLREDAERYRWLRGDACPDHSVRWTQWEVRCWRSPVWSYDLRRQELDQAIDDARAAEEKKG